MLAAVGKQLQKDYDVNVVKLGDKVGIPIPSIATGMPTFDKEVAGCGGIPRGRLTEIIGPESSGKTTLALHCVAQEQKAGNICAYIDMEHALDPTYASKLGVDVDNLLVCQPDFGEQALETAQALVDSQSVGLIVVDSVAALVPRAELEGEMGDSHMGLQARLMSQACRKLVGKCAKSGTPIIFINQIREKIGVMFGSPETTPGGRALKFYASMRLDVRKHGGKDGLYMSGTEVIGHQIKIKAIKNKVASPFRETVVDLYYGVGFDLNSDIVQHAINSGVITQTKGWVDYKGDKFRKDDPKLLEIIKGI